MFLASYALNEAVKIFESTNGRGSRARQELEDVDSMAKSNQVEGRRLALE